MVLFSSIITRARNFLHHQYPLSFFKLLLFSGGLEYIYRSCPPGSHYNYHQTSSYAFSLWMHIKFDDSFVCCYQVFLFRHHFHSCFVLWYQDSNKLDQNSMPFLSGGVSFVRTFPFCFIVSVLPHVSQTNATTILTLKSLSFCLQLLFRFLCSNFALSRIIRLKKLMDFYGSFIFNAVH